MHAIYKPMNADVGIIIVGALSLFATIFGYKIIHSYARIMSWISGIVLAATFLWIVFVHGLPVDFLDRGGFNKVGFLGAVSIAALWQLAYAPMSLTIHAICPTAPTIKAFFMPAILAAF